MSAEFAAIERPRLLNKKVDFEARFQMEEIGAAFATNRRQDHVNVDIELIAQKADEAADFVDPQIDHEIKIVGLPRNAVN